MRAGLTYDQCVANGHLARSSGGVRQSPPATAVCQIRREASAPPRRRALPGESVRWLPDRPARSRSRPIPAQRRDLGIIQPQTGLRDFLRPGRGMQSTCWTESAGCRRLKSTDCCIEAEETNANPAKTGIANENRSRFVISIRTPVTAASTQVSLANLFSVMGGHLSTCSQRGSHVMHAPIRLDRRSEVSRIVAPPDASLDAAFAYFGGMTSACGVTLLMLGVVSASASPTAHVIPPTTRL